MTTAIHYFGYAWPAGVERVGVVEVPTPVGAPCLRCRQPMAEGDQGYVRAVLRDEGEATDEPVHVECEALGLTGHAFGVCSCTGYDTISREAALTLWRRLGFG